MHKMFPDLKTNVSSNSRKWITFLLFLTCLIYLRATTGDFIWDDRTWFLENDILTSLKPWDLKEIFLLPANYGGENLPLKELLFITEYNLFGTSTLGYHIVSLVLYMILGLIIWRFLVDIYSDLQSLDGQAYSRIIQNVLSVLIAMSFFMLHPLHVEVVAYITTQQYLLLSIFSFLSISIFYRACRNNRLRNWKYLLPFLLFYFMSFLCKYQAIGTSLFIPALWLLHLKRKEDNLIRAFLFWLLINIPVVIWILFSINKYGAVSQTDIDIAERIIRAIRITGAETLLVFVPYPLNFGYPFDESWSFDVVSLSGLAVFGIFLFVIIWHRRSLAALGMIIYILYLFPVMQLVIDISNATIYDRYLFIPLLGMCIFIERIITFGITKKPKARLLFVSISLILIFTLGILTFNYIPKFKNDVASLEHGYVHFPGWKRVAFDYEYALIEAGRLEKAMMIVDKETTFSEPPWVRDYFRGWIYLEQGNIDRAVHHLSISSILCQRGGYYPFPDVHLGRALIMKGKLNHAEIALKRVINSPWNNIVEYFKAKKLLEKIKMQRHNS